tara:strand:+ start:244 stop:426 length:183 start_codon:yes stop_codon:yes gene_type:complete
MSTTKEAISEDQIRKAIKEIIDDAPLHVLQDFVYETMLKAYAEEDEQTRETLTELVREWG